MATGQARLAVEPEAATRPLAGSFRAFAARVLRSASISTKLGMKSEALLSYAEGIATVVDQDRPLSIGEMKRNAARAALEFVEPGAVIGVGSGTTVSEFIEALAHDGPHVAGVIAASKESARHLSDVGITVFDAASRSHPSLYVDGADEVDMKGRAIKGGGAAQTCEKAIAYASEYWACIVDVTKVVRELHDMSVPLEVDPGQVNAVSSAVAEMGGEACLRLGVMTDAGNPVMDAFGLTLLDPVALEDQLDAIPGVVGNGVFAHRTADVILVGRATGGIGRIVPKSADEPTA